MKLVILDRDGVINQDSDDYIKSPEEWLPLPGSAEAIALLNQAGYQVVVATNQSGIGRGYYSEETLAAIHNKMLKHLADHNADLASIFYCPHTPDDQCDCRKPASGLLDQIAARLGVSLAGAPLVGDSLRDLQAGLSHQCRPVLVKTGKGLRTLKKGLPDELTNTPVYNDLHAFVVEFLSETDQLNH